MLVPDFLRTEYKESPRGIDVLQPRLSWVLESDQRGERQTAYQVLIATSRDNLDADKGDLWDSGKIVSDNSTQIVYEGSPLKSRMECWWKVRVWDKDDKVSSYSEPAFWTMGLLSRSDWRAKWIGFDEPPANPNDCKPLSLDGCSWIWLPEKEPVPPAPGRIRFLRKVVNLPLDCKITSARFLVSSGDQFTLFVNGTEAGTSDGRYGAWRRPSLIDVAGLLGAGQNVLAIRATYTKGKRGGIIGKLQVDFDNGSSQVITVDTSWKVSDKAEDGWNGPKFDDQAWLNACEVGKAGDQPWGALGNGILEIPHCPYLRESFEAEKPVKKAVAYASALGHYELRLNGEKVGNDLFTPGWTDYRKRVHYQTYDVTEFIEQAENVLGVTLGHGWYSGYLGGECKRGHYGRDPRALIQLELTYQDGTTETVVTDASWKASHSPLSADHFMGAQYDARKEVPGWDSPGFDDSMWQPVAVQEMVPAKLCAHPGVPVRQVMELTPLSIAEPKKGVFIYDLGQNMVGWVRLRVEGKRGTKVTLRFAEMLNPDGTIYIENLRSARCTDEYWLKGSGEEVWEPRFTFHGFRYVEIAGYPGKPTLDTIAGIVAHSAMPLTGAFECSNPMINQLQHNIVWGQRGNFLDIPTDCPQRDERLGWTGDAQVFARTACFNMDTGAFFTKWMQDVEDAQTPEGAFPDGAPRVVFLKAGSPAWADAGIIVPWTMYQCYGDTRIIEKHYDAMRKWIEFMRTSSTNGVRTDQLGGNYADWLSVNAETPRELIATAFYAYSVRLFSRMAAAIGRGEDATRYEQLFQEIKEAFNKAFVMPDGRVRGETQTCYVLALQFDLLPDNLRPLAAQHLVFDIKARGWHLSAGFLGTPYLLHVLRDTGYLDVAYRLLKNDTFPSWGYTIKQGATTMWERWDGWTDDGGFQTPEMNSFNHYAFGAVGDWMYRTIAGIDIDPKQPGYRHIIVHPRPGGGLNFARGECRSIYGTIVSDWRKDGDSFTLKVVVPANTRATVYVPTSDPAAVTENGKPATQAECVSFKGVQGDCAVFEIGSGTYGFASEIA